jgi:hypothetical protein
MAVVQQYREVIRLKQRQVLRRWERGYLPRVSSSTTQLMDLFCFFLEEHGVRKLLGSFPDFRLRRTIGIYFFAATLLFKALLKANAYEALPPRLFSNTYLLRQLGFNLQQIEEGFSRKGDQRPFDVESLLDALRKLAPEAVQHWYIEQVIPWLTRQFFWPAPFLILDTIRLEVDPEARRAFPGAPRGYLRTEAGQEVFGFGYKLVVLAFPIGKQRCGVLAAQLFGLAETDWECGKALLSAVLKAHPELLRGLPLLLDRGFLDATWMVHLKRDNGLDTVIPLKANMDLLDFMRALVTHEPHPPWESIPQREHRRVCWVGDLVDWQTQQLPLVGCYIEDRPPGKPTRAWGLVSTAVSLSSGRALYDLDRKRWTIEEGFCQLRKLEEFDRLTVAHLGVISAQLLTECLAHTLAMVFLEELGQDYEEIGARRRRYDLLAQPTVVVVEIGAAYALLTPQQFNRHLDENLQVMAARQRRDRARDGPGLAQRPRR